MWYSFTWDQWGDGDAKTEYCLCLRKSVSRLDFGWKSPTLKQSHDVISFPLGEMEAPYISCDEKSLIF